MSSVLVCNRWVTSWALTSDPKKTPPCTACWSTACTSISPSESTFCLHQLLTTLLGITTFCLHQLLLNITIREQTNPVSHARMCWNAPCDHWRLWWFGLGNLLCCCWLACRMWVCSNQCSVFLPAVELSITVFTQGIICIMTSESN